MQIASWNIFGLGGVSRLRKIKSWLRTQAKGLDVLLLQEMRIREDLAVRRLLELAEGDNFVVDYSNEGKARAAVILLNKIWKITERGVKGDGREVDCRGDWNSVKTPEDSVGDTAVQHGGERRKWQGLKANLDLEDSWITAETREGPHFTRQQTVGGRLDQARLDRIYFSQDEAWVGKVVKVIHDTRVVLSDHRPVILSIKKRELSATRKSSYFKVPPELIQREEVRAEMRRKWEESGVQGADPREQWDWKWQETRRLLMQLANKDQAERRQAGKKLEELEKQRIRVANARSNRPDQQLE
ncbi:hypothetical protein R1sor_009967 [Riccia sorocarpa]|uniref:Endonuclease/exonuclease/phosphatase domain-containing protein n=1 Tax=Riccia sorocarpa TaxID=122646 RepID=A0ABD3I0P7_9MARC